jgi:hypothetical protein
MEDARYACVGVIWATSVKEEIEVLECIAHISAIIMRWPVQALRLALSKFQESSMQHVPPMGIDDQMQEFPTTGCAWR